MGQPMIMSDYLTLKGCKRLMDELDLWLDFTEVAREYRALVPICATNAEVERAFVQAVKAVMVRMINSSQSI